jgi:hypothetical protein
MGRIGRAWDEKETKKSSSAIEVYAATRPQTRLGTNHLLISFFFSVENSITKACEFMVK